MGIISEFGRLLAGQPTEEFAPVKVPVETVTLKFEKYNESMRKKWIVMLAWYRADIRRVESKCTDATWEKVVQAAKEGKKKDIEIPRFLKPTQDYHNWSFEYDHKRREEAIPWNNWYDLSPSARDMYTPAIHITITGENGQAVYDAAYDRYHKTDPGFAERFHNAFWELAQPLLGMKLDKNQTEYTVSIPNAQGGKMPLTTIGYEGSCNITFAWNLAPADFAGLSKKEKKKLLNLLPQLEKALHGTLQALVNAGDMAPKEGGPKKDDLDWFVEAIAALETEGTLSASFLKKTNDRVEFQLEANDGDRELTYMFFEMSDKYEDIIKKAKELREKAKKDNKDEQKDTPKEGENDPPTTDDAKYRGKGTIRPLSAWEKLAEDKTKAGAEVGLLQFKGEISSGAYDGIPAEGADACQMLAARIASGKCTLDPPKFLLEARDDDIRILTATGQAGS